MDTSLVMSLYSWDVWRSIKVLMEICPFSPLSCCIRIPSLKPLGGGLILYCEKIDQCFGECYLERLYSIYLASNDSQESLDGR